MYLSSQSTEWPLLFQETFQLEGLVHAAARTIIDDIREDYASWYQRCLSVLPEDLAQRFRDNYDSGVGVGGIRYFLEREMEFFPENSINERHLDSEKDKNFLYEFNAKFLPYFVAQRNIIGTAWNRNQQPAQTSVAVAILETMARRFHVFVRQLQKRYGKRPTIEISDEHDVQYFFHALLRIFFEDVRAEDHMPNYAGGPSRIDFLLPVEQVGMETKMTRESLDDNELGKQLSTDVSRYRSQPKCKTLIIFIYDPDHNMNNPSGIKRDLETLSDDDMAVRVVISP